MSDASPALQPSRPEKNSTDTVLKFATRNARILAPLLTLIVLVIFFSITTDTFLRLSNFRNVVTQVAPIAVAATGVTFVLLCAEIDLSIASIATFAGMLAAWFWVGDPVSLGNWGILVAILVAAFLGLVNGFFISYVGIPSFMMTLAMLTIAGGLATFINDGKPIFDVPDVLPRDRASRQPLPRHSRYRMDCRGGAHPGAHRAGLYALWPAGLHDRREPRGRGNVRRRHAPGDHAGDDDCGLTAGIAGILFIGRLSSASPAGGQNMLIDTIAAVVLGGTSLFGGEGGMLNTVLGLLIFAVLSNGLNLLPDISIYFKEALTGIILLCALLLNVLALRLEKYQRRTE